MLRRPCLVSAEPENLASEPGGCAIVQVWEFRLLENMFWNVYGVLFLNRYDTPWADGVRVRGKWSLGWAVSTARQCVNASAETRVGVKQPSVR